METQPSPHPTTETLLAYAVGELDDAAAQFVREHLEHCSDCRRQVADMPPDSFLGRLCAAQEGSGMPASDRPVGGDPQTESPVADGVTVDSSAGPCMSATGQVEATSAAPNTPSGSSLQSGMLIGYFGDYELERVLGEGGMGIVYKARQLSLNRPVALKMIRATRFASTDGVRRFHNEAEAVARLVSGEGPAGAMRVSWRSKAKASRHRSPTRIVDWPCLTSSAPSVLSMAVRSATAC